jgi:hypothetical protein
MKPKPQQRRDARSGYEPLLHELLTLYPALAKGAPPWRDGYTNVAFLAHGWYLRCHRSVQAVLRLGDGGYAEEAAPVRRSIIEHVLALRWLAAEGDKILDTIARAHAFDTKSRATAVVAAGWTSIDVEDLEKIIADIDPDSLDRSRDRLLQFASRLSEYGDEHTRPGYIAESAKSHPTYESAVAYVDVPGGDLRWQPREPVWPIPFCTTHLFEALICVREAFDPKPWESELDSVIKRYQSVTDEVRKQDGLPPIDWSTATVKKT